METTQQILSYVLTFSTTAHLVGAATMALFARHKVEYLAIAWIMGLIAAGGAVGVWVSLTYFPPQLGIMHPSLVLSMLSATFLQSIYPLSFTMPGYLQWGRMWRYASPAIVIILFYCVQGATGGATILSTWSDVAAHWFLPDVLLRFAALILSAFYISGIIVLPHYQLRGDPAIPGYVKGYCTVMAIIFSLFLALCIHYNMVLTIIYIMMFTMLNLYLMWRTLETMAVKLLLPQAHSDVEESTDEPVNNDADSHKDIEIEDDFNALNITRFTRVEQYMSSTRDWADNLFGRDKLCAETGLNRHLLLQALRSQGWNNIHEYINSYRVARLKRFIETHHDAQLVNCCYDSGFGTLKTARAAFERFYATSLDEFWNQHTTNSPRQENE